MKSWHPGATQTVGRLMMGVLVLVGLFGVVDRTPADAPESSEWRRSQPDVVVYVPKGGSLNDGDNEHFLVFPAPKSDELLAIWTQSSVEGRGDNHLVIARSSDGVHWSAPQWIVGTHRGTKEPQASWGFPVVAKSARLYCFFTKELPVHDNNAQGSGAMGCYYSDDNGREWRPGADIPMPRNRFDNPDTGKPRNWIVWQKPIRDRLGRWVVGYTQCTSNAVRKPVSPIWCHADSRCAFMRFDNLDEGPDPKDIKITWLPKDREGLEVPDRMFPEISVAQEPSIVLLPDGRLFCVMRTMDGHAWCSVSSDDGATWREPEPMRYRDGGDKVKQPLAPCPIYRLDDGRYLFVFHNNDGTLGDASEWKPTWTRNESNFVRHPAFLALGEFRPNARQPIWFSQPKQILDTDGVPVGPKGTNEIATYTSLTEWHGRRTLWYPDRKHFLLGKHLSDELLSDMVVPAADAAQAGRPALNLAGLQNPIWQRPHGVRDPAVLPVEGGYYLHAYGVSPDLVHWTWNGPIDVPVQNWMTTRYGAPFVWREPNQWMMILMGCDPKDVPQVGLLSSADGLHWTLLSERLQR